MPGRTGGLLAEVGRYADSANELESARESFAAEGLPLRVAEVDRQLGWLSWRQGRSIAAIDRLVPASLLVQGLRTQFLAGEQRKHWDYRSGRWYEIALAIAAELGAPRLVAELVEASKAFAPLPSDASGGPNDAPPSRPPYLLAKIGRSRPTMIQRDSDSPGVDGELAASLLVITARDPDDPGIEVLVGPPRAVQMPWHGDDDYALRAHHERAEELYGRPTVVRQPVRILPTWSAADAGVAE